MSGKNNGLGKSQSIQFVRKERLEWLSLLRGLNIIFVVMFHVQLIDMSTGLNNEWCEKISLPFSGFRMPLFIFVSGGLLYLSRIKKEWSVNMLYFDKAKRIVLPFFFFVTFYYFLKVLLNPFVKTKTYLSLHSFVESFYIFSDHPSAHLWFLATLMQLMLLYPLFKWLCMKNGRMIVFGILCCFFFFADLTWFMETNYFNILKIGKYLVYFFFGITFFYYEWWRRTDSLKSVVFFLVSYILFVYAEVPLLSSISGILLMVSLSQQLSHKWPNLFISFREYIFPIYLLSFVFQPFVELILWKKMFYNEQLLPVFYLLNVLIGIYGPVLVCKIIEHIPCNFIKYCFGLTASSR